MSIKPILFNTEMVKAILDGRKTVTRRVVKDFDGDQEKVYLGKCAICAGLFNRSNNMRVTNKPPYQPNDIIYVRETQSIHRVNNMGDKYIRVNYKADGVSKDFRVSEKEWKRLAKYDYTDESYISPYWTTYETCRIWLKVTNVRVERLQDITHTQADNEGVGSLFFEDIAFGEERYNIPYIQEEGLSRHQFAYLWDSTVKKQDIDRYGWNANPWVWVIEFERCEKPQEENKNADK